MQPQNFVTEQRNAVEALVQALDSLEALHNQWDKQGLAAVITQDDLTGDNADITPQMLADGWNAHNAIKTALDAGYWVYLYNLLR